MSQPPVHASTQPQPIEIYRRLRQGILGLAPAEAGLIPTITSSHVWGILMETGYPNGVVTLVCLSDGTTSLYFSTGGGIIGSGQHNAVSQATQALLTKAETALAALTPTQAFPLPAAGQVQFIALTYAGKLIASAVEEELVSRRHPLTHLFDSAQEVITQIRLIH